MTERVRFTISVEPEVYEAFADLSVASGVSLSRCIGDWLRDTAEAAQITTIKVNEIRKSPQDAFAAFIRDGMVPTMVEIRRKQGASAEGAPLSRGASGARGSHPPSSNTGGKGTGKRAA
jgi:hypothetical protein